MIRTRASPLPDMELLDVAGQSEHIVDGVIHVPEKMGMFGHSRILVREGHSLELLPGAGIGKSHHIQIDVRIHRDLRGKVLHELIGPMESLLL